MRVLHVISGLAIADGHAAFCLQLAEQLAGRGLAQRILSLPTPGEPTHPDPRGLVQFVGGRQARLMNLVLPLGLRRQWAMHLAGFQPTIVHLHGGWHPFLFLCMRLARRAGLPVVLTLHGSLRPAVVEQDRRLKKRLAWHLYQRRLVAGADQIHVASEAEQSDLARLGFDQPVHVIPNGVTLTEARLPCEDARSAGESRTLLYLGRLHPLKGLDLLLEAWGSLRPHGDRGAGDGRRGTGATDRADCADKRRGTGDGRRETGDGEGETGENAQRSSDQHPYTPIATRTHAPTVTFPDTPQCFRQSSRQSSRQSLENATPELPNSQTLELPPHPPTSLDWRLVIAGPDEQGTLAALERQARRLGLRLEARDPLAPDVQPAGAATEAPGLDLDPTIIYVGPCYGDEKLRLLREADLVVLPSRSENFGLVIAEALAAGVPVVTTKAAPWAELLGEPGEFNAETQRRGERDNAEAQRRGEEGNAEAQRRGGGEGQLPDACFSRCGWWVEVGAEPLAEALGEAMSLTDEDRRLLGANGHRLVEAKYRWEAVAEQVVEAYRQVRGEA